LLKFGSRPGSACRASRPCTLRTPARTGANCARDGVMPIKFTKYGVARLENAVSPTGTRATAPPMCWT